MFNKPNYTQTPNEFFDEVAKTLKEGELRIMLVVMRQTFGWGNKAWDRISISQLMNKTGMKRDAVVRSTKSLVQKKLVTKHKSGTQGSEECWYSLVVESPTEFSNPIDDSNSSYQSFKKTPPSLFKRPTKETLTKETKKTPYVPTAEAAGLSASLLNAIKSVKADFKSPDLAKWSKEIDLMIKLDKRAPEAIKSIIEWLPGSWWLKNVLSADKLRKQFDRLQIEMTQSKKADSKTPISVIDAEYEGAHRAWWGVRSKEKEVWDLVKKHFISQTGEGVTFYLPEKKPEKILFRDAQFIEISAQRIETLQKRVDENNTESTDA